MNVDVGDVFSGAIIPGLILVSLYAIYIIARVSINPSLAPKSEDTSSLRDTTIQFFKALLPPLVLITIVLGTIISGKATPTEAAACGALGSIIITFIKGKLNIDVIKSSALETTKMTAMVFTILMGAQIFSVVFRGLEGDWVLENIIRNLGTEKYILLAATMLLLFVLGFFLDFIEISFIVIPVILPILSELGFDKLWLTILIALNLQTSFLTPPFGFALFYLKGSSPPNISTI